MLKITTQKTRSQLRLVLQGRLVLPWVAELDREWIEIRAAHKEKTLVVDLRNVTVISQAGENILLEMMSEGAAFVCGGVFNNHVLHQLERRCKPSRLAKMTTC